MIWDWGWTWKNIDVQNAEVAIDATAMSIAPNAQTNRPQGVGVSRAKCGKSLAFSMFLTTTQSLTVLDSNFVKVKEVIRISPKGPYRPAIFLDNINTSGTGPVVNEYGASELLGPGYVRQWGLGWRYNGNIGGGENTQGPMSPISNKPRSLLASGKVFERSKPQYEKLGQGGFLNILGFGAKNDGSPSSAPGNTKAINDALRVSAALNRVLLFPAGIYLVDNTVNVPVGARLTGALWSQIMATGVSFGNPNKPKVFVKYTITPSSLSVL